MVLKKYEIEQALREEKQDIAAGRLKEDNPLDLSDDFKKLCEACRKGDLKTCQEKISLGVNINARDRYDYTPLILASLCGHYETVELLLTSGALCERDTFQGERCLYNALNDRIRDLLLSYDFSKSTNLIQPLTAHVASLPVKEDWPETSDITLSTHEQTYRLHKFLLAARSPYFAEKLRVAPGITSYRLPQAVPPQSLEAVIRFIYLGEVTVDQSVDADQQATLTGIDRLCRHLQVGQLFDDILRSADRRLARQVYDEQTARGREQLAEWYSANVLRFKLRIPRDRVAEVKWDRDNATFADILLRADESIVETDGQAQDNDTATLGANGIPTGGSTERKSPSKQPHSILFPVHRAMLLRSEFFLTMFSSDFKEAQQLEHLQVIPIDCSPEVLEIILTYLYTESADIPLDLAIEVIFAADLLMIEKLKQRAAIIISTLGSGSADSSGHDDETSGDAIDIYEVVRAGWDTRVQRLEDFGARYLAQRLESFIDEPEFLELVKESAARIQNRQSVDSLELIDDIRFHLSERFRLRFEDSGLEEMMIDNSTAVKAIRDGAGVTSQSISEDARTEPPTSASKTAPDAQHPQTNKSDRLLPDGSIRDVDDDLLRDSIQYNTLLSKIDELLEKLGLEA